MASRIVLLRRRNRTVTRQTVPPAGYEVALARAGDPLRFTPPAGRVGIGVLSISIPVDPGPAGTRWMLGVRSRSAAGLTSEPATIIIPLVSEGGVLVHRPSAPTIIDVQPMSGNRIRVRWSYTQSPGSAAADSFRVQVRQPA